MPLGAGGEGLGAREEVGACARIESPGTMAMTASQAARLMSKSSPAMRSNSRSSAALVRTRAHRSMTAFKPTPRRILEPASSIAPTAACP